MNLGMGHPEDLLPSPQDDRVFHPSGLSDWETGARPFFARLSTGLPVFSLGSECAGTRYLTHFAVDLPTLAQVGECEGEAACHPLPQLL